MARSYLLSWELGVLKNELCRRVNSKRKKIYAVDTGLFLYRLSVEVFFLIQASRPLWAT